MPGAVSRRRFVTGTVAAATSMALASAALGQAATAAPRKIKIGLVGGGPRGRLIGNFCRQHGGYEIHGVADYFPDVARAAGDELAVDGARRFSGLGGYKKLIDSGVEALLLENVPYFMPGQAAAAVAAGCHVYIAKPVAVDVPGCMQVAAAARQATQKGRCFFVDYQMSTDPVNIEIVKRIRDGGLGEITHVATSDIGPPSEDPPKTVTVESRLQRLVWVNDVGLGCDYIGNSDIHVIDAAQWVLGQRPVAAMGASRIGRPDAHGDARDICSVVFEYASGLVHNHWAQAVPNVADDGLACRIFGTTANAQLRYFGKSYLRGGPKQYGGEVASLYDNGILRNVAAFHQAITQENFDNPTVPRAIDGTLTCILGRDAARRRQRLTMDELLKENKKLDVDLTGLKND